MSWSYSHHNHIIYFCKAFCYIFCYILLILLDIYIVWLAYLVYLFKYRSLMMIVTLTQLLKNWLNNAKTKSSTNLRMRMILDLSLMVASVQGIALEMETVLIQCANVMMASLGQTVVEMIVSGFYRISSSVIVALRRCHFTLKSCNK